MRFDGKSWVRFGNVISATRSSADAEVGGAGERRLAALPTRAAREAAVIVLSQDLHRLRG